MKPDEVQRLYNREYANSYDDRFLHSELARPDSEFEIETLRNLLRNGGPWLDVACGTGFFLSKFPEVERQGLDLSPAMIEIASARNPGVEIVQQSFLEPMPEWRNKWALVSCMWYAYGLVSSMAEVEKLVENLAGWTAPDGVCFVPLCDPVLIAGLPLSYEIKGAPWKGRVLVTGITWSYHEDDGSRHEHMVAPHVSHMISMFETYFEDIRLIKYPSSRPGLLARGKRSPPNDPVNRDARPVSRGARDHLPAARKHRVFANLNVQSVLVRWREWWFPKIPFCFLIFALGSHEPLTWHAFVRLVALVFIVSAVANYGHAINDLFDRHEDEKSNKPNVAIQFGTIKISGVAIVSAALAEILSYCFAGFAGGALTACALVLPALYSIPPIRLKERRWWGLVADASAAHVYPAVFSILMASSGFLSPSEATFLGIVALWSFVTGLRNIIMHQLSTEGRDRESGLNTIVHNLGIDRVARLVLTILSFEVISLLVVIGLSEANVVFLLMTASYILKEAAQYALEERRVSFDPTELVCPFINNAYYLVWAPLAAFASLALHDPSYAFLVFGFALLFWQNLLSELREIGGILKVASGSERDLRRLIEEIEERDRRLVAADRDLRRFMAEVEERDRRLMEAGRDLRRLMAEVEVHAPRLVAADRDLRRFMTEVEERDRRLVEADRDLRRLIVEVEERDRKVVEADRDLRRFVTELEERDRRLMEADRDLRRLMAEVEEHAPRLVAADRDLRRLMAEVEERDRRLVEADRDLRRLMAEVEERDRRLVEADRDLRRLMAEVEERDRRLGTANGKPH